MKNLFLLKINKYKKQKFRMDNYKIILPIYPILYVVYRVIFILF